MDILIFSVLDRLLKEKENQRLAFVGFVSGVLASLTLSFALPFILSWVINDNYMIFVLVFGALGVLAGPVGGILGGRLGKGLGEKGQIISAATSGAIALFIIASCYLAVAALPTNGP